MKTLILGLLFLGFTSLSFAQNDLAMVDYTNKKVKPTTIEKSNAKYFNMMKGVVASEKIQKLQQLVRSYDIASNAIYTPNSPATYSVNFKEGKNTVTALYDHNGNVIESSESFQDIKLPYAISSQLAKDYPGWEFNKVHCQITYANQQTDVIYKVVLKMNRQKKTVRINASDYLM